MKLKNVLTTKKLLSRYLLLLFIVVHSGLFAQTNQFTVKTPRHIDKVKINRATVDDLVIIQHIDYDLAYEIVDQRILRDGFTSFDELTKVKGFPIDKIEIIKLYLTLN